MALHPKRPAPTSGRLTPKRDRQRSQANNVLNLPCEEPLRLRNACDQCHQLKRKCSGDMPCENCTLSNPVLCSYRPVNRLGRPRGSRNRQKTSTDTAENPKRHDITNRKSQQTAVPATTEPIAFPSEPLEPPPSADVSWDYLLDADLLNVISKSDIHMIADAPPSSNFDHEHQESFPNPSTSPFSTASNLMFGTLSYEQPLNEQPLLQEPLLEWQQFPLSPGNRQPLGSLENNAGSLDSHDKNNTHHIQSQNSPCQCAQGLRTLLASLGRSFPSASAASKAQKTSERQPLTVDTVLSNASRALEQWTALETCHYCSSASGEEQRVENIFLLAFMSVQCVLGQLRSLTPDSDFAAATGVRVGNFDVTGQNRTTVLEMLRIATAQDIERAVEALRGKINGSFAATDGTSSLLTQIGNMLEDLTSDIRVLQQQQQRPNEERSL